MKHNFTKFFAVPFAFALLFSAVSNNSKTFETNASNEDIKLVYNCSNDINEAFNGVFDRNADSDYWSAEALNIREFLSSGLGASLADKNGILPSASAFDNKFSDEALSIKTYSLYTNNTMYQNSVRYFNQYPAGWKMAHNDNPSSVAAFPSGNCSANVKYLKYYFNGSLHPGDGAAVVLYFKAPYKGIVSIKDSVSVSSSQSDGIYNCIYTVPCNETRNYTWNSVGTHAMFGGYPIYPTKNVSPSASWTTGWQHIAGASSVNVSINDFSINKGDYLVFIYASGPSNGYDSTYANPIITYDEASVKDGIFNEKKEVAIVKVKEYVNSTDYRTEERETVNNIINDAVTHINSYTSLEDIDAEVASARALLDQVKTDKQYIQEELADIKNQQIASLANFVDQNNYRETEKNSIQEILNETNSLINNATSQEEITSYVELAKSRLLSVNTDSTLTLEELNGCKRAAMEELENSADLLYYDESQRLTVNNVIETYKANIYNATTKQEVENLLESGKKDVASISKTNNETKTASVLTIISSIFAGIGLLSLAGMVVLTLRKRGK